MKKHLTAILGATLIAASGWAQEVSYATTVGIESKYVFRGFQLGEETFMGAFDVSVDDFYAGVWTAQPTTDEIDWGSEVDFYAGYGTALNEVVSLDFGATYYYYPDATDASTFESFIGASWDVMAAPAVYVYYDFDLETFTFEGSIGNSWDIAEDTTFDLSGSLGFMEPDAGDGMYYLMASAGITYSFQEYATGTLGANFSDLEDGENHFWFGTHVSVEF